MVNEAYGYRRVDEDDIQERFAMGDPGSSRGNRVLHVAFQGDRHCLQISWLCQMGCHRVP